MFSIYDGEFADESFEIKHTEPGLLGMCKRNGIADTNQCQFYVTLGVFLSFLDNQCVVFGRVIQGFRIFKLIDKLETVNEIPNPPVQIEECGDFKIEPKKLSPKKINPRAAVEANATPPAGNQ